MALVKLTDEDGYQGCGEGSPSCLWSSETMEAVTIVLKNDLIPSIIGLPIYNIDDLHQKMEQAIGPEFSVSHSIASVQSTPHYMI